MRTLARCERIRVFGSSALLAGHPELGEPGQPLELSFDADLLVEPCDEATAAMLHEAVGEGSLFAQRTGYHADIPRPEIRESLPPGWETRLVKLTETVTALPPEDLATVKLRVGRPKDLELCRHLLRSGVLSETALRERLATLSLSEAEIVRVYQRLEEVLT